MSADLLRYRGLLAAAVGAGVVLGAAGVFLYHQLHAERARRHLLRQELDSLGGTVAEIQRQLELLRCRREWKRYRQNAKTSVQEVEDEDADTKTEKSFDLFSVYSTEDDEEFFDLSSEDEEGETVEEGPLKDLFETVDSLFNGNSECKLKAFDLLTEKKDEYLESVGLLWRLAKACHSLATIHGNNGDLEKKKEMVMEGYEFAKRALELDDANAEVHKWFAITVGSRGEFIGTREKIEDGVVFKEHVDTALSLHPTDPSLHHLLGRFIYEVATLTWVERKIAGALFAEVPKGTFPEAVEKFEEAEKLSPTPWKENRLLLAKALIGDKDYSLALQWLKQAAEVPVKSPEDAVAEKEIQELLIKYAQYETS